MEFTDKIFKIAREIGQKRDEILEEFAKAYLAETQLLPSEVEMVWQQTFGPCESHIWFRKRELSPNGDENSSGP